jgi:sec-independent protein translocase protein TatA
MGELSPVHIAIVPAIVLLVFGPKKLPEMGRSLGKGIREFKDATSGLKHEVNLGLEGKPIAAVATPAATPTVNVASAEDASALATAVAAVSISDAAVAAAAPAAEPAANVALDAAADQAPDALSDQAII